MKNKRKKIKKYLSLYDALETENFITYVMKEPPFSLKYIWYKNEDKYLQGPPHFKLYSLKEFYAYAVRMCGLKAFW